MSCGDSLHIGLNAVDQKHYQGWDGLLNACEADAEDMEKMARSRGFTTTLLKTKDATRAAVLRHLTAAAAQLKTGDIFVLTCSSHGGQLPDLNGDEVDGKDETLCLYDGQLVDDELFRYLSKFAAGVRLVVFSDSCHSGTLTRAHNDALRATGALGAMLGAAVGGAKVRAMPEEVGLRTYRANREMYDSILQRPGGDAKVEFKNTALLISGCQDNQESLDGSFNGLFTSKVLKIWNQGRFRGSYRDFHARIVRQMPPTQTPNYYVVGPSNPEFEAQSPFFVA